MTQVTIVEVSPRDGLQYEKQIISIQNRLQLIRALSEAGFSRVEAGSFVSPKAIPQMAGSLELAEILEEEPINTTCRLSWLVPNMRGLEDALSANVDEIAVFTATRDSFTKRNINKTVKESLKEIKPLISNAVTAGIMVRGYVSTIFGFGSEVTSPKEVLEVTEKLLEWGCYEVSLGDTTGIGTPNQVEALTKTITTNIDTGNIAYHFHDTAGAAADNVKAAYNMGIHIFDSSIMGLGGCPYADSPKGNIATELLIKTLKSLGATLPKLDLNPAQELLKNLGFSAV